MTSNFSQPKNQDIFFTVLSVSELFESKVYLLEQISLSKKTSVQVGWEVLFLEDMRSTLKPFKSPFKFVELHDTLPVKYIVL